jgi:hypothetical protein
MAYTHAINGGWSLGGIYLAGSGPFGDMKLLLLCVTILALFVVAVLCSKRVITSFQLTCICFVLIICCAGFNCALHCVQLSSDIISRVFDLRFPCSQSSVCCRHIYIFFVFLADLSQDVFEVLCDKLGFDRDWHPLIPADCSIAGEPKLVAYRTSKQVSMFNFPSWSRAIRFRSLRLCIIPC